MTKVGRPPQDEPEDGADTPLPSTRPRARTRARQRLARQRRRRLIVVLAAVALAGTVSAVGLGMVGQKGMNTSLHQHPQLTLVLSGTQVSLPSDIGIDSSLWLEHSLDAYGEMASMSPIHTHDSSGVIHLEMGRWHPCTLGDFFRVWGQAFGPNALLDYRGPVSMTVDGKPSDAFGDLVLQHGQQIVLRGP